jgi:hypothetical protein
MMAWQRVYETPDALEVDEGSAFTGLRQRVFYDEVQLVTLHGYIGWGLFALLTGLATLGGLVALVLALAEEWRSMVTVIFLTLFPLGLAVARVAVKVLAVTVYGRRSKARVSFWFNRGRARATFERLCARVRHVQQRSATAPPPPAA